MNQKNSRDFIHKRASSDNVYNRISAQKEDQNKVEEEMRRLDKRQQKLLQNVRQIIKIDSHLGKKEKIRVIQWTEKLSARPKNVVWRKNIIFYLEVLIEMINQQTISAPFSAVPNEGALPNLKLLDLPFPVREILMRKDKNAENSINKKISKENSIERHKCKAKSINFDENMEFNMRNLNNSTIKIEERMIRPVQLKSCQVSQKRSEYNSKRLNLKLTADCNKQNNSLIGNSSCITRRLFQNQVNKSNQNDQVLLTYKDQKNSHHRDATVCQFDYIPTSKTTQNRGIELLSKVYELLQKNSEISANVEAQSLCLSIRGIAKQKGVFLSSSQHNQSIFSSSSTSFRKASENIRQKFVETDEQTLEFMSFLQKFRVKNQ